nr:MAG TPA: hypothetical protein [Bacteriophage sp.]
MTTSGGSCALLRGCGVVNSEKFIRSNSQCLTNRYNIV